MYSCNKTRRHESGTRNVISKQANRQWNTLDLNLESKYYLKFKTVLSVAQQVKQNESFKSS